MQAKSRRHSGIAALRPVTSAARPRSVSRLIRVGSASTAIAVCRDGVLCDIACSPPQLRKSRVQPVDTADLQPGLT